eukprot:6860624-Prymnesium_polylepis.1
MAPDATVLVAPRRQNSFSHRSFDGEGVLGRRTDAPESRHVGGAPPRQMVWLVRRSSSLRRFRGHVM